MAKDDKLKGKPRSVRAAQKAGSKYFFDKNGVKKLAVTAEQLKKTGLTLRQWANQTNSSGKLKKKPEGGIKVKKPDGKITVTKLAPTDRTGKVLSAAEKQLNKKSRDDKMDATNRSFGSESKRRNVTVSRGNMNRKKLLEDKAYNARLNRRFDPFSKKTYAQWKDMSREERRDAKLPLSVAGGLKNKSKFKGTGKPK